MPEEEKEKIEQEKKLFILSSAAMIEALKNNEATSKDLLCRGGPVVQQRVLATTDRLRDWIAEVRK